MCWCLAKSIWMKIIPTVTIVLNFSEKRWNKPISLHEMLKVPKRLKPFVQDYQIKAYDIAFLEDEIIEKFTSDFRLVAKYLKMRWLGKVDIWVDDRQEIKHVEEVLDFFRVFTKDERYEELLTEKIKSMVEKGRMTLEEAAEEMEVTVAEMKEILS